MKRNIIVTIETDESGRYCGEECISLLNEGDYCQTFDEYLLRARLDNGCLVYERCAACLAAEKEVGR